MQFEDLSKMKQTMVKKFWQDGMTFEQAYDAYSVYMRSLGSKGGKNGTGNAFAHGKVNPATAGRKGSKARWQKSPS